MAEKAAVYVKTSEIKQKSSSLCKQESRVNNSGFPADRILHLQRTAGNQAVQRLIRSGVLQAKLKIGQPHDMYEQEADRVAEQVMRMPEPKMQHQSFMVSPLIQRQVAEEETLQTKENGGQSLTVSPSIESSINALRGGGLPLDSVTLTHFEPRFGNNFSEVRVHTDSSAVLAAQAVNARAFTIGNDVVFGAGQYAPNTREGQRLLGHELTHVVQQGGQRKAINAMGMIQKADSPISETTSMGIVSTEYRDPEWKSVNQLGIVRVEETSATLRGARLRQAASSSANILHHLEENTRVFIISENQGTGWVYANVANKQYRGSSGYVSSALVWRSLPDPEAVLYYISDAGMGLQKLVENHEQYKDYDIRTGDDARSIVMAVLVANDQDERTKGHVYLNKSKLAKAQDPGLLEGIKDKGDEYRRVLRPILQSVELLLDKKIWLPGKQYTSALKDKGIIPTRPEWKNVAIAVTKGIGGFLSGLVEGFFSSIIDVFVGIYDLIKSIISQVMDLISGEAIRKAKEFYDTVSEMSAEELLTMLLDAVTTIVGNFFKDFERKWNANNLYQKWSFRGNVVGYVLAEVLMAIFSGGIATATKWLGKLGKLGSKLAKVLTSVFKKVDSILDKIPGRKKRSKLDADDRKGTNPEKMKQLPLALSLAAGIAEAHDAKDSPVSLVLASLLPLKARFKWIDRFSYHKKSPGHYRIVMIGSEHDVDRDYTTDVEDEASDLPEGTHREITADTARVKYVHDRGVEHGKIKAVGDGLSPTNPGTGKGWNNPYEFDGPFGHGIDDIMFNKKGNPVILEYKGGISELGPQQMKKSWICIKIRELKKLNDPMAIILEKAMKNGLLTGRIYRTPVDKDGNVGKTHQDGKTISYKGKC